MFPSECVLESRVRSDGDKDLADNTLQLFMLECKDRKAEGYEDKELEIYNQRLEGMEIGVRLAGSTPAVSYLAILGASLFAGIVAVDKTVIVIRLGFTSDGGRMSYLIYDAVALSLRMIPLPRDPRWTYTLSSNVSIARPCQGDAYALVHTGLITDIDDGDCLYMWRSSSSSQPWFEYKESGLPNLIVNEMDTDMEFSFNGIAYWVDLLCGLFYCSCDAILDENNSWVEFKFIPLPVKKGIHHLSSKLVAEPVAYRTIGVVCDSFIRFVSINGFQEEHVKLENRTVTVWKLVDLAQEDPWQLEHEFSLEALWNFIRFRDVPKDLTPMYPLLSTKDAGVVYLVLGECNENPYKRKFMPTKAHHLLTVDMQNKIVISVPLGQSLPNRFVSCDFSLFCEALIGPCDDEGIPIPDRGNVTEPCNAPVVPCDEEEIPIPMMKEL